MQDRRLTYSQRDRLPLLLDGNWIDFWLFWFINWFLIDDIFTLDDNGYSHPCAVLVYKRLVEQFGTLTRTKSATHPTQLWGRWRNLSPFQLLILLAAQSIRQILLWSNWKDRTRTTVLHPWLIRHSFVWKPISRWQLSLAVFDIQLYRRSRKLDGHGTTRKSPSLTRKDQQQSSQTTDSNRGRMQHQSTELIHYWSNLTSLSSGLVISIIIEQSNMTSRRT